MAEEITVVGEGSDTAGSTSSIDRETLRAWAPEGVGDALRRVPGLHVVAEDGAGLFVNVGVRGLPPSRSAKVLVLEDGVPIAPGPYGHPELYWSPPVGRVDTIEVVRGSGSIRFGPQTIGGVINYRSAPLPAAPLAAVEARGGAYGLVIGRAAAGSGGARGGWRLDAEHRRYAGPRAIDLVATDVAAKGGAAFGASAVVARASWATQEARPSYLGLTTPQFEDDPTTNLAQNDRFKLDRFAGSVELRAPVGARGSLRATAYGQQIVRAWTRQDWDRDGATVVFADASTTRDRLYAFGGLEQELRVQPPLGRRDPLALRLGLRLHHEHERQLQLAGDTADDPSGTLNSDDVLTGDAGAAWVDAELALGPTLLVAGGARLEAFWRSREARLPELERGGGFFWEALPGLGLSWRASPGVTVWAGAHRGWAPPSTTDSITGDGTVLDLEAEHSWNVEAGGRLRSTHASADLTAFALIFEDQLTAPSEAGVASDQDLVNGDPTRHLGLELEARLDVAGLAGSAWAVEPVARWGFVDARYTGGAVDGNLLPYAPRHVLGAELVVAAPLGAELRGLVSHVGPHYADAANTRAPTVDGTNGRIDGWTTVDVVAGARVPLGAREVRAQVAVKNLTDTVYVASRAPAGIQPAGFRTWEVSLSGAW